MCSITGGQVMIFSWTSLDDHTDYVLVVLRSLLNNYLYDNQSTSRENIGKHSLIIWEQVKRTNQKLWRFLQESLQQLSSWVGSFPLLWRICPRFPAPLFHRSYSISKCYRFPTTIIECLHKWQLFLWRSDCIVPNRFETKPTYDFKKLSADLA